MARFVKHNYFRVVLIDIHHENCRGIVNLLDVVDAVVPPSTLSFWFVVSFVCFLDVASIELFVVHEQAVIVGVISFIGNKNVEFHLLGISRGFKLKTCS